MTAKRTAGKKHIVTLSEDECECLNGLIQAGRRRARRALKAGILLAARASTVGERRTDSQSAEAMGTSGGTPPGPAGNRSGNVSRPL